MEIKRFVLIFISLSILINLVSGIVIKDVSINPTSVSPGGNAKIHISLKNNDKDVKGVMINLELNGLPIAPYKDTSSEYINEIDEDEEESRSFDVIVLGNAKTGVYKIPIEIQYKLDNEVKTQKSMISLIVNSKPNIEIIKEKKNLIRGLENEIKLKIVNNGISDVKFLEVELEKSFCYSWYGKEYVGDLDSDDYESVSFNIKLKDLCPSVLEVPVKLKYKDSFNRDYTKNFQIDYKVYSKKEAEDLGLIKKDKKWFYIWGVVGLVVLYLIYKKLRKIKRT